MISEESRPNWFLAQIKPNSYGVAQRNLERQGFGTFMPFEERTIMRVGKYVTVKQPLFPGYLFVAFYIAHGVWRAVNSTYGVSRLVSFGNEPAEIPYEIVSLLKQRCDVNGVLVPSKSLKPGDKVTINKGPFTSFVAEVEKVDPERRAWVLLDLMGGETRIKLNLDQLGAY